MKAPHLILGIAFRWFDEVQNNSCSLQELFDSLISLQCCHVRQNPGSICVNPYHWALVDQFQGEFFSVNFILSLFYSSPEKNIQKPREGIRFDRSIVKLV